MVPPSISNTTQGKQLEEFYASAQVVSMRDVETIVLGYIEIWFSQTCRLQVSIISTPPF